MQKRTRKTAAAGAAAFVLAGSAFTASSGTAQAATISANCGDSVTASPGDTIKTPFGSKTVTDGLTSLVGNLVGGLLGGVCTITVHVVDTVVAPVAGSSPANTVNNTLAGTTNTVTNTVKTAGNALSGSNPPAQQSPGNGGTAPQQPTNPGGGTNGAPASGGPAQQSVTPGPANQSPDFSLLPFGTGGYAPMVDYSGIPFALTALWAPGPGLRYGGEIPGYGSEAGALGTEDGQSKAVQNAGQAEALPGDPTPDRFPLGLPMLIAVLALSGVSAALVRSWVLRQTRV